MKRSVTYVGIAAPIITAALIAWAASDNGIRAGGVPVIVWCALITFAINWAAFIPSFIKRTEHFYDLTGSATYLTVVAFALFAGSGGATSWILAVLIWGWAARLGSFLFLRVRRAGSDGRFDRIKHDFLQFLMFWTIQCLWVFLTAAAALTAMSSTEDYDVDIVVIIGVVVWLIGMAIEVVSDRQKSAFRADPNNQGRFISTGLWAWSRHPNYVGEITLWVGIAIIALPGLSGWQYVTLISPVFVYVLLTRVSGVPALELRAKKKWGGDDDYRSYLASTPVLWPRPR